MNETALSALAVASAYLIGAIPFGYWLALGLKGVDVRTVGSGNIGATNVGRVLGFRWFWVVFTFDLAKGLVPTWCLPRAVAALAGSTVAPELPVLVALATIMGHNYPVYLAFKGGKGVATSLGAMLALDPVASLSAATMFVVALLICRYVSLSSLLGAGAFALVHFARASEPFSREQRAMTLLTVALVVLMIARHRKNLVRIGNGTEPKVPLRRTKPTGSDAPTTRPDPPRGRIAVGWLLALAAASSAAIGASFVYQKAGSRAVLNVGRYALREVSRAATGHQRAERVLFAGGGRVLAVTCPRYQRVVLYRVAEDDSLSLLVDLELDGQPVAVGTHADHLYILQRPAGDHRHIEPGWVETFDLDGRRLGERARVGFYPDDLAIAPDGRHLVVITSGRAEGDQNKPRPAADVYRVEPDARGLTPVGRLTFDDPHDDPSRLSLSASGRGAVVTLLGSNAVAAIDLTEPANPTLIGRSPLPAEGPPYPSRTRDDWIVMPAAGGSESVIVPMAGVGECVVSTLPRGSALELTQSARRTVLGRLPLRTGALGLSQTRPTGVAFSPDRGLLAVANRSGGVHLVAVRPDTDGSLHPAAN